MKYARQFPAKNEDGLVALMVVGIMIILLSLTTVAFTKLMSRESRQALDRQLSTQAYYAAQSGINDAKDYISTHPDTVLSGTNCDTLVNKGYPPFLGQNNDEVNKVTCVLADTSPQELFFQIPAGKSRIFQMSSTVPFGAILFSWDNAGQTSFNGADYQPAARTSFDTVAGWNGGRPTSTAPVLEVTYYPMPDGAQDLSGQLIHGRTIFLYPSLGVGGGQASTYNSGQPDGKIVYRSCQGSATPSLNASVFAGATSIYHCNTVVKPTISPPAIGQSDPKHIFVKVSSYYGTAKLLVRANDNSFEPNPIAINGAQAVLDATGKGGGDVLKRLQTIVNYRPTDIEPGDTLETVMGLCKRLEYNLTLSTPQINDPSPDVTSQACHAADIGL